MHVIPKTRRATHIGYLVYPSDADHLRRIAKSSPKSVMNLVGQTRRVTDRSQQTSTTSHGMIEGDMEFAIGHSRIEGRIPFMKITQ